MLCHTDIAWRQLRVLDTYSEFVVKIVKPEKTFKIKRSSFEHYCINVCEVQF